MRERVKLLKTLNDRATSAVGKDSNVRRNTVAQRKDEESAITRLMRDTIEWDDTPIEVTAR